ncbi:DUF1292 domain-containing protein [Aneurinibacillus migulanus]|uniref:DUF1292 domain-containing protein n=1 Tax=Aneurinibacillus migulanus TaxID=47500 RepID=UPI002E2384EB|nr:DUF1292 domain-containing protein [Aneurinibacillus migulanus]
MSGNNSPLDILLCDESMKEEYIGAKLVKTFSIGTNQYAVVQKENTNDHYLLKIVDHNGAEELHEIESETEFESVVEVFRKLP